jgi:hypothetical protein
LALRRTDTGAQRWIATGTDTRRGVRGRVPALGRELSTPSWLIPLAIAGAYLLLFVAKLPHDIRALGWNPDVGSAFAIPETVSRTGTDGFTVMASAGQWVPLWFGLLTARLPLHRELWGVAPTLDFVATALIVGWSVRQVADRRTAALAVLIGLVASPIALTFFMASFSHNTVYPCTALLGAYLIWLTRTAGRRKLTAIAVPPILGIAIGACLASDLLLAATAVIPLTLTAILAATQRDRRSRLLALSALTTAAISLPTAKLTTAIMHSAGYVTLPSPVHYATLSELPSRAALLFKGLKELFNGYLGTEKPGPLHTPLGFASDIVMSAALLTLLAVGTLTIAKLLARALRASDSPTPATPARKDDSPAPATPARGNDSPTPATLARSLHIAYWTISAVSACGAFWIAGEGPVTTHESYYATAIFSVAAVVPLLLSRSDTARRLILAGATVFFAASFVGMTRDYVNVSAPLARSAPEVVRIAEAYHAQTGYSNWGDSSGLTWGTDGRVIVRPLIECQNPSGADLCPGFQAYVPSWYVPRERRTFLLIDANEAEIRPVPAGLGKPLAVYAFDSMQMYIYPYDIASRVGPPLE